MSKAAAARLTVNVVSMLSPWAWPPLPVAFLRVLGPHMAAAHNAGGGLPTAFL